MGCVQFFICVILQVVHHSQNSPLRRLVPKLPEKVVAGISNGKKRRVEILTAQSVTLQVGGVAQEFPGAADGKSHPWPHTASAKGFIDTKICIVNVQLVVGVEAPVCSMAPTAIKPFAFPGPVTVPPRLGQNLQSLGNQ